MKSSDFYYPFRLKAGDRVCVRNVHVALFSVRVLIFILYKIEFYVSPWKRNRCLKHSYCPYLTQKETA